MPGPKGHSFQRRKHTANAIHRGRDHRCARRADRAEFRLPLMIAVFWFGALRAAILNKAMSLVVVTSALPFRASMVCQPSAADRGLMAPAWVGGPPPASTRCIASSPPVVVIAVILLGHDTCFRSVVTSTGRGSYSTHRRSWPVASCDPDLLRCRHRTPVVLAGVGFADIFGLFTKVRRRFFWKHSTGGDDRQLTVSVISVSGIACPSRVHICECGTARRNPIVVTGFQRPPHHYADD